MANIANNTYLFYGDRTELVKCHEKLNELYEKVGSNTVCVDLTVENTVINGEWINYLEDLSENSDSFKMETESKWYGNPVYWHDWVKTNFPKLSVAFMCEEPGMEIFEKVDPDNKFDEYIYIWGSNVPDEYVEKLPPVLEDALFDGYLCGTFLKDEVFDSEFQPSDLPDCITYKEYTSVTYDEIRASDEAYLAKWSGIKEKLQHALPDNVPCGEYTNNVHDAIMTDVDGYLNKWSDTQQESAK